MNPLDHAQPFVMELMNPNPSSSKTKSGPVYRVSFEVTQDDFLMFMDANTSGMILAAQMCVQASHPEPVKGGPISQNAAALCRETGADSFARQRGHESMRDMILERCGITSRAELDHDPAAKDNYEIIKSEFYRQMFGPPNGR